jgi:hypothetical protein
MSWFSKLALCASEDAAAFYITTLLMVLSDTLRNAAISFCVLVWLAWINTTAAFCAVVSIFTVMIVSLKT